MLGMLVWNGTTELHNKLVLTKTDLDLNRFGENVPLELLHLLLFCAKKYSITVF